MSLFEFDLARVEDVTPWGEPGRENLSWFALTDGTFRIVVGSDVLFRYTDAILAHWGSSTRDAEYQVAAFARDMLGSVAAAVAPVPPWAERIATDPELLARLQSRPRDGDEDSRSVEDTDFAAWRWLGERSPWTSYLVAHPNLTLVRIGDQIRISWDNSDRVVEGIPVWMALRGAHVLPVESFLAECRDFADRLLAEMTARISRIAEGTERDRVEVDVASLRQQHEIWRTELMSYFREREPEVPWSEAETAVRAITDRVGVHLSI